MANIYGARDINRNNLHPRRSTGAVLFNGVMNQGDINSAENNINPLYDMPTGQYWDAIKTVSKGDIIYRMTSSVPVDMNIFRSDNTSVPGISALNGQGTKGESNHQFMERIDIIGVAFMENDVNKSARYNIHTGGIETVPNNGNEPIRMGDWVIAYAPDVDEVSRGGKKGEAEKNGVLKLWYKPYKPEIHKLNTSNIYRCLTEDYGYDLPGILRYNQMNEFKDTCKEFYDSILGMGILVHKTIQNRATTSVKVGDGTLSIEDGMARIRAEMKIPPTTNDPHQDENNRIAEFLSVMGHSQFTDTERPHLFPEIRQRFLDTLFNEHAPHTGEIRIKAKLFRKLVKNMHPATDDNYTKLQRIQSEAVGSYVWASANFFHMIVNRIMGKAVTPADPGYDFDIQFTKYCL